MFKLIVKNLYCIFKKSKLYKIFRTKCDALTLGGALSFDKKNCVFVQLQIGIF